MSDLCLDVNLPFAQGHTALMRALSSHRGAVIQAPPGTGKTTLSPGYVADFLANDPNMAGNQKVLVTQPRRVAARASAARLNELYGKSIAAHTVRGESTVSSETIIEFLTPGVLLRRLLRAPELEGVGAVLLDEVHERQLESDLVFAMVTQLRELREDLHVVAMSATVDAQKFADLLGTPIVDVPSPIHPLQFHYAPAAESISRRDHRARPGQPGSVESIVANTILQALSEQPESGDVLAFVPTIRGTEIVANLVASRSPHPVKTFALHGSLTPKQQQAIINPNAPRFTDNPDTPGSPESQTSPKSRTSPSSNDPTHPRTRRVIVATDVAESSLTVPGVSIVVDSCLSRVNRRDSTRGMSVLVTELTSQASATQRAGRAGRLGPGEVYRCISAEEYGKLPAFSPPAIQISDLTGALLDCACWGSPGGTDLPLPDPFPEAAASQATQSLQMLGAISEVSASSPFGSITPLGEALASLPMDPHLARGGIIALQALGFNPHAANSRSTYPNSADSRLADSYSPAPTLALKTLALLDSQSRLPDDLARAARELSPNHPDVNRMRSLFTRALKSTAAASGAGGKSIQSTSPSNSTSLGPISFSGHTSITDPVAFTVACAFPHLIARRVPGSEQAVLTTAGTGALVPPHLAHASTDWFAIADISRAHTGDGTGARIRSGLPLTQEEAFAAGQQGVEIKEETTTSYDRSSGKVRARTTRTFGAIELASTPTKPSPEQTRAAIESALASHGLQLVDLSPAADSFARRIQFLADAHVPGYPSLRGELPESVRAFVADSLANGKKPDIVGLLRGVIPWDQPIDELAPESLELPNGRRARVTYPPVEGAATDNAPAVVATKLQDCFGLVESPIIGNRRVQFHLLSPAQRPLAVTDDLASFWDGPYQGVRKDMRGRYPKHAWPEDPR